VGAASGRRSSVRTQDLPSGRRAVTVNRPSDPAEAKQPGKRGTRVIAVANQKGGVGKSTTAVSLGAALAEMGRRVLVVDLDPQGNASTGLGIRHDARKVTVYDVLANDAAIMEAVVQTPLPNLFAIPSTIDLAGAEIELVSQFSRELKLRKAMEPLRQAGFDFVFLDCPPSLGLLTVNAMAAAQELMVPIQCEYYALEGLGQLIKNVRLVQQNVNPALRLSGIVMTMFDPRTKLSEQVVAEVRRFFGDRVYDTIIPRTVRLSEAPGFGQPITVYDPRSRGAKRYRELAGEVVRKEPVDEPIPVLDSLPLVIIPPPEPVRMTAPRPLRAERAGTATGGGGEGDADPAGEDRAEDLSDESEARKLKVVGATEAGDRDPVAKNPTPAAKPAVKVEPERAQPRVIEQPPEQPPEQAGGAEQEEVESSPGDEDQKRRWSLFRRGGQG